MRLRPEYLPYLAGEKHSANLAMKMADDGGRLRERIEVLEELVGGKRVIHVGCLDHLARIEKHIAADTWLHKRLTEASAVCLGVDIDPDGIALVHGLGYDNVILCDLVEDEAHPAITAETWDYMVLGEVIEHIDNPVRFLESIAAKYGACVGRLLVTVPNAFHVNNFINALRHREKINTDHRFWFTPYTLAKVASAAGFEVVHYELCLHRPNVPRRRIFYRALLRAFPMLRGSIVMELAIA